MVVSFIYMEYLFFLHIRANSSIYCDSDFEVNTFLSLGSTFLKNIEFNFVNLWEYWLFALYW